MKQEELNEILEQHKIWLDSANLYGANLNSIKGKQLIEAFIRHLAALRGVE